MGDMGKRGDKGDRQFCIYCVDEVTTKLCVISSAVCGYMCVGPSIHMLVSTTAYAGILCRSSINYDLLCNLV